MAGDMRVDGIQRDTTITNASAVVSQQQNEQIFKPKEKDLNIGVTLEFSEQVREVADDAVDVLAPPAIRLGYEMIQFAQENPTEVVEIADDVIETVTPGVLGIGYKVVKYVAENKGNIGNDVKEFIENKADEVNKFKKEHSILSRLVWAPSMIWNYLNSVANK